MKVIKERGGGIIREVYFFMDLQSAVDRPSSLSRLHDHTQKHHTR